MQQHRKTVIEGTKLYTGFFSTFKATVHNLKFAVLGSFFFSLCDRVSQTSFGVRLVGKSLCIESQSHVNEKGYVLTPPPSSKQAKKKTIQSVNITLTLSRRPTKNVHSQMNDHSTFKRLNSRLNFRLSFEQNKWLDDVLYENIF